jgi:hypothetical protein
VNCVHLRYSFSMSGRRGGEPTATLLRGAGRLQRLVRPVIRTRILAILPPPPCPVFLC